MKTIVTALFGAALCAPLAFSQAAPQPKLLPVPTDIGSRFRKRFFALVMSPTHSAQVSETSELRQ